MKVEQTNLVFQENPKSKKQSYLISSRLNEMKERDEWNNLKHLQSHIKLLNSIKTQITSLYVLDSSTTDFTSCLLTSIWYLGCGKAAAQHRAHLTSAKSAYKSSNLFAQIANTNTSQRLSTSTRRRKAEAETETVVTWVQNRKGGGRWIWSGACPCPCRRSN